MKTYYAYAQNKSGKAKPITTIRSDGTPELGSIKSDEWLLSKDITFKPLCPYFQEENGISEQIGRTIMDMTRATIIGRNILDDLWPEVALAMVHVKNIRPTRILEGKTPYELFENKIPTLDHLRVLGSTVYVLIHEKEQKGANSKGAKFAPRAQRGKLVGYDGKTIYRVYLEKDFAVIRVKNLRIYEDATAKVSTSLPIYKAISIDKQGENNQSISNSKASTVSAGPKRKRGRPRKHSLSKSDSDSDPLTKLSEASTPTPEKPKQKRRRPRKHYLPGPSKTEDNPEKPSNEKIQTLITKLHTALIEQDWEEAADSLKSDSKHDIDPLILFAKKLKAVQAYNPQTFAFVTQFDLFEPTTYEHAMSSDQAEKWTEAITNE